MKQEIAEHPYPFSAIVGQQDMKLALSLIAVQPAIGGVLISGERGTAKTTAVRALPAVLGGGPTPLAEALGIAGRLMDRMREESMSVFLLSDGRYDRSTGREDRQIRAFGERCRARSVPITFLYAGSDARTARERGALFAAGLHARLRRPDELCTDDPAAAGAGSFPSPGAGT